MELKQEAQTFEMPHLLTYYECDETSHPSLSMILSMISKKYNLLAVHG